MERETVERERVTLTAEDLAKALPASEARLLPGPNGRDMRLGFTRDQMTAGLRKLIPELPPEYGFDPQSDGGAVVHWRKA